MHKKAYWVLTYRELDDLIHKLPNRGNVECVSLWEWNNEEDHATEGVGSDPYKNAQANALRDFDKWMADPNYNRPWSIGLYDLLTGLFSRYLIPPGNYLIRVWW